MNRTLSGNRSAWITPDGNALGQHCARDADSAGCHSCRALIVLTYIDQHRTAGVARIRLVRCDLLDAYREVGKQLFAA